VHNVRVIEKEKADALRRKVSIILAQLTNDSAIYRYTTGEEVGIDFREKPFALPLELTAHVEVADEQLGLLRMLHDSQDAEGRRFVIEEVAGRYAGLNGKLLLIAAKFGGIASALALFKEKFIVDIAADVITPIAYLLCCDSGWISDAELDDLCKVLHELARQARKDFPAPSPYPSSPRMIMPPPTKEYMLARRRASASERFENFATYICGQVATIHYMRLKKELEEGANFEINQDRDRLADSLQQYGFSRRLVEFLQFAEREFDKAADEFSYKTCIDQVRSFFAELLTETADKIAASRGTTLETERVDRTRPVEVRKFLLKSEFFSEQFELLSNGFYKFMSDEGTHTLGSTKEVARVARNLAVEIGLLITKRVGKWE
jgi:hypothetical protein